LENYQVKFEVRTKALYDKLPEAATLMKEMLFTSNIDDEKRLYEIVAELKSRLQVSILPERAQYQTTWSDK